MDENAETPGDKHDPLREFLESLLGPGGAQEASEMMRSQGFDISSLSSLPGFSSGAGFAQAMAQMRFLMNSSSDPVNWRMVEEMARQQAYQSGDPALTGSQAQGTRQAMSVADLWLDPATELSAPSPVREAWTRVEWIDQTLPAWKEICNPIAENAARVMSETLRAQIDESPAGLPEGIAGMAQSLSGMLPKMAAMGFAAQIGNAITAMSKETLGLADSGLPLSEENLTALLPTNVAEFADGLDVPFEEIVQFLATRECAHARLFAAVPWLRHDLQLAIIRYAREISMDEEAIAEAARSIDPSDPESLKEAMSARIFSSQPTEDQMAAQERLETLLALIEGWVEVVTAEAVAPYLPHAAQLREMMRRRKVTGSNGDRLLEQLLGLEMRPRQTRNAAKIFKMVQDRDGLSARDALWAHPDRIPSAEQLAAPDTFFDREEEDPELSELDAQFSALLAGTLGFAEDVPKDKRGPEEDEPEG